MFYINFSELCNLKRTHLIKLNPIDSFQSSILNNYHNNLADPFLAVIKENNARVNDNLFVKTNDDYIIQDIGYREKIPVEFNNSLPIEISESTFLLGGDTNYYHWLINWIPRLFLYESLGLNCKIIVNSEFSKSQFDILKTIFPWVREDLIIINKNNFLYRTLYIPNFFLNPIHSPNFISKLRQRIFSLYYKDIVNAMFPKKILISRNDAKFRKIINEDELFEKLKPMGFQKIRLRELSFIEQINLFYHAKVILAPHGAGLANLVFCNSQPDVIEIMNDAYTKVFWSLGFLCGSRKYNVFKGSSIIDIHLKSQQYNIFIDIDRFLKEQQEIISMN